MKYHFRHLKSLFALIFLLSSWSEHRDCRGLLEWSVRFNDESDVSGIHFPQFSWGQVFFATFLYARLLFLSKAAAYFAADGETKSGGTEPMTA